MFSKLKSFIATFKNLPIKSQRLLGLGLTVALVLALPAFVWGISTQRFNFLKRAASGEATGEPPYPMITATPTVSPKPPTAECLKYQGCPVKTQTNILRNCYPSGTDGTPTESLCNIAGRVETCGPNYTKYCCSKAGGSWVKCPGQKDEGYSVEPVPQDSGDLPLVETPKPAELEIESPYNNTPTPKSGTPTPTPKAKSPTPKPTSKSTTTPTPISTYTPTSSPISVSNNTPKISTGFLINGLTNRYYSGTVRGYENGSNLSLYMTFDNLPRSLANGGCTTVSNSRQTSITCKIVGYPESRGIYYINARIFDQFGNSSTRRITLFVFPSFSFFRSSR